MKKIVSFVVLVIVSVLFSSVAASESVKSLIYPLSSEIYSDIDNLYALNGLPRPSTNRPWSDAQTRNILERINYEEQSGVAKSLYERVLNSINQGLRWDFGDDFQMSVGLDLGLEMYAHTNGDEFDTESDWERSYNERKSLMKVYFEFAASDFFYTTSDIHYKWARSDYNDSFAAYFGSDKVSNDGYVASYKIEESANPYYVEKSYLFSQPFATSFFTDTMNFSFIWPKRAVLSLGGNNWNFSINRDDLEMGNATFGNLLVDDHSFSDFSRFTVFGKKFNYDFVLMYLNTLVSDNEQHPTTEGRIFMIHTLQFRILEKISMTVSENVVYKYSNFDLLYLNPAFIYHNLNNRSMFNALAYLDFNFTPIKGLELYGQYALDQARAPHEGDSQSDASGLVVGASYTHELLNGVLKTNLEFATTTPLLYRRDIVDFVRVNRDWSHAALDESFGGGHVPFFDYIGFPYGGDTILIQLRSDYTSMDDFVVGFQARFVQKGEMNLFESHNEDDNNSGDANKKGKTPSGDTIKQFVVLSLEGGADMGRFFNYPGVSLDSELDWIGRWNYTKSEKTTSDFETDLQFTFGATIKI